MENKAWLRKGEMCVTTGYNWNNHIGGLVGTVLLGDSIKSTKYKSIPEITKVVYDIPNGTTITYFADDTKEIARVQQGEVFDKEQGVMACVVKKMYGSRSAWKKIVDSGVEVKPKKNKVKNDKVNQTKRCTYSLQDFIDGKHAIFVESEDDKKTILTYVKAAGIDRFSNGWKIDINNAEFFGSYQELYYYFSKGSLCYGYEWDLKEDGISIVKSSDFINA